MYDLDLTFLPLLTTWHANSTHQRVQTVGNDACAPDWSLLAYLLSLTVPMPGGPYLSSSTSRRIPSPLSVGTQAFSSSSHGQGFKSRPEPVRKPRLPVKSVRIGSGSGRFQTGPNSKFKFELKKIKNS